MPQYVKGADDPHEHAAMVHNEEAMHFKGKHLIDDGGGRSVRGNREHCWSHHVTHSRAVDVLHLKSPAELLALGGADGVSAVVIRHRILHLLAVMNDDVESANNAHRLAFLID